MGLLGGILLGLAARLGRFCTLGAIEDLLYGGSSTRIRLWAVAIGLSVIGSFVLMALGALDPADTFYLANRWSPTASIVGGLFFGYGMALAGNCGFTALARLGGGDLRSFVIVVVIGLAALATISGPFAWIRVAAFPAEPAAAPAGLAHILSSATSLPVPAIGIAVGLVLTAIGLMNRNFRADPSNFLWAGVIAAAILLAWAGTSFIHITGFSEIPVRSHTFSAPIGGTMLYAMTASGQSLTFGIGSVAGVWIGAFIGSLIKGHFRWEACEDPRELRRQIFGAALMGTGAGIAAGCSIGQGLSAFSVLALSGPVTMAAIFVGAAVGLRQLITGFT